jgi:hypothetical protein
VSGSAPGNRPLCSEAIARVADRQRVEILPRLWASYDRGISGGMFLHDLIFGAATGRRALRPTGT